MSTLRRALIAIGRWRYLKSEPGVQDTPRNTSAKCHLKMKGNGAICSLRTASKSSGSSPKALMIVGAADDD